MYDSHMHTPLCGHASGQPGEYVASAREAGLLGVVVTDHCPMPGWFDAASRMKLSELAPYHESVLLARHANPDLFVGIGLEADFHPGTEYFVENLRKGFEYDYLIGSVHFIGAWPFDHPDFANEFTHRNLRDVYRDYFQLIEQAAESGLFHSIGHLDLPKKFGNIPAEGYLDLAENALQAISKHGLALDINTAGWRKQVNELYPSSGILSRANELKIPVVLGSDAHKPQEVGYRFADAVLALKTAGYTEAVVFQKGLPQAYKL